MHLKEFLRVPIVAQLEMNPTILEDVGFHPWPHSVGEGSGIAVAVA